MIKLGIIYGGISTEHDVSEMSAKSVMENLDKSKYEIKEINTQNVDEINTSEFEVAKNNVLKEANIIEEEKQKENINKEKSTIIKKLPVTGM